MKLFIDNKHFELETENEEDKKILNGYNSILEKNGADILTDFFDGKEEPSIFSFHMCENPIEEQEKIRNGMSSVMFEDFVLRPKTNDETPSEYGANIDKLFYDHTKSFCDFVISVGGEIISRIWLANTVVIFLPSDDLEIKIIDHIKEHGLFVSFKKDEIKQIQEE